MYLGIDIGTSAVKGLLCDAEGRISAAASEGYALMRPRPGWTEQDPRGWWEAAVKVIRELTAAAGSTAIGAVGLSGQMHGAVLLRSPETRGEEPAGDVVRPAILWNDQRTAAQCREIEQAAGGRRRLVQLTGNAALPGFTLPKLMWVREHEPESWARVGGVLMPKDYIRWRLTGEAATDVGDASGTLLFDVAARAWSGEMCRLAGIDERLLPRVLESGCVAGRMSDRAAAETGLPGGIPVVAGSGDNMMGAIGAGVVREGMALATLGTSGVIYAHTDLPRPDLGDAENGGDGGCGRTHAMCAADGSEAGRGGWCATGCMLSAAGALQWAREALWPGATIEELLREAEGAPIGCEGLVFLPHLAGERCPHPDPGARGAWVGLSSRHTRGHLVRAIVEGVTMTMGQILDLFERIGIRVARVRLGGGGARSAMWRQMQADVYGREVALPNTEEGPALGAVLLAGVAAGAWRTVRDACEAVIRETELREPEREAVKRYAALRDRFARVYPALRTCLNAEDAEITERKG
jgi:xylulokinase